MSKFLKKIKQKQFYKHVNNNEMVRREHIRQQMCEMYDNAEKYVMQKEERRKLRALSEILGNIFYNFVLRKVFKFSSNKCNVFASKYKWKKECVEEKYVTLDDIVIFEIMSTDKEYSPIGISDYSYSNYCIDNFKRIHKPGSTSKEWFLDGVKLHSAIYMHEAFRQIELICISALHDFFGFGKTRIARFIDAFRHQRYKDIKEVYKMIEWLNNKGISISNDRIEKFKMHENVWFLGLLPTPNVVMI